MSEYCAMTPGQAKVFLRDATGLVRELTPMDAFWMNLIGVGALNGIISLWYYMSSIYPGADAFQTLNICMVIAVPFGIVFALMATAFPRSGGDYVWNSRIIHPAFGLMGSGLYLFVNLTLGLGGAPPFVAWSFANMFSNLAEFTDIPALSSIAAFLTTPLGQVTAGLLVLAWAALVVILGLGAYRKMQIALIVVGLLGTATFLGVLALSSQQSFINAFNIMAARHNTSYLGVIQIAEAAGYKSQPYSLPSTLLATIYLFGSLTTAFPILVAGEIRRPRRSQMFSIVGSILVCYVLDVVVFYLTYYVFGREFVNAITWLAVNSPSTYPFHGTPFFTFLAAVLSNNPILTVLINLSIIAMALGLMPCVFLIVTRPFFAYAFDRVFPTRFASIDDRTHAPIFAIGVSLVIGVIAMFVMTYTGLAGLYVNSNVFITVYFMMVLFGALVFPLRKGLFGSTPSMVQMKIGPVPIISILAGFALCGMAWAMSMFITNPQLTGPVNALSLGLLVAILAFFGGCYFLARWYWKTHGIDIALSFKEIPPE